MHSLWIESSLTLVTVAFLPHPLLLSHLSLSVFADGNDCIFRSQDRIQRVSGAPLREAGRCLHSVVDPVLLVIRNHAKRKAFRSLHRNYPHSIPLCCLTRPPPTMGWTVRPDPPFLNFSMYTLMDQVKTSVSPSLHSLTSFSRTSFSLPPPRIFHFPTSVSHEYTNCCQALQPSVIRLARKKRSLTVISGVETVTCRLSV